MENQNAVIERVKLSDRTLGSWYVNGKLICKTLELPWKDNKRRISCIPNGKYQVTKEPPIPKDDPSGRKYRPYPHFRIHGVPNRSGILVHRGRKPPHSAGCILVGLNFTGFSTATPELEYSKEALQQLVDIMPDGFILEIKDKGQ